MTYTDSGMVVAIDPSARPAPSTNGLSQLTPMPFRNMRDRSPTYGPPLLNARL